MTYALVTKRILEFDVKKIRNRKFSMLRLNENIDQSKEPHGKMSNEWDRVFPSFWMTTRKIQGEIFIRSEAL